MTGLLSRVERWGLALAIPRGANLCSTVDFVSWVRSILALSRGSQKTHLRSIMILTSMTFKAILIASRLESHVYPQASAWPSSPSPLSSASAASLAFRHENLYLPLCEQSTTNSFINAASWSQSITSDEKMEFTSLLLILSTPIFHLGIHPRLVSSRYSSYQTFTNYFLTNIHRDFARPELAKVF